MTELPIYLSTALVVWTTAVFYVMTFLLYVYFLCKLLVLNPILQSNLALKLYSYHILSVKVLWRVFIEKCSGILPRDILHNQWLHLGPLFQPVRQHPIIYSELHCHALNIWPLPTTCFSPPQTLIERCGAAPPYHTRHTPHPLPLNYNSHLLSNLWMGVLALMSMCSVCYALIHTPSAQSSLKRGFVSLLPFIPVSLKEAHWSLKLKYFCCLKQWYYYWKICVRYGEAVDEWLEQLSSNKRVYVSSAETPHCCWCVSHWCMNVI